MLEKSYRYLIIQILPKSIKVKICRLLEKQIVTSNRKAPNGNPLLVHKNQGTLSPEKWLYEIYKRIEFNNNLSLPKSFIHLLEPTARANLFLEKISENNLDEFLLTKIHPVQGKPIKALSVSDAFPYS